MDTILYYYNTTFPLKTVYMSKTRKNKWITQGIQNSCKRMLWCLAEALLPLLVAGRECCCDELRPRCRWLFFSLSTSSGMCFESRGSLSRAFYGLRFTTNRLKSLTTDSFNNLLYCKQFTIMFSSTLRKTEHFHQN
jgi:hypothetical protein